MSHRAVYTIIFVDAGGRAAHVRAIEFPGDEAALERIARLRHTRDVEIWCGERLVWKFEPLLRHQRSKS